jgi:protein SCO1/2
MKTTIAMLAGALALALASAASAAPRLRGVVLEPPLAPPTVALHDQAGRLVRISDYRKQWLVVSFLYTHCPDVCPLIADQLNLALRHDPALHVIAISVDPKRDTHRAVTRFIASHRLLPRFRYLTGTAKQLTPIWRGFHVAATPNGATVSHSAFEILIDPKGKERVLYDSQVRGVDVVHDVDALRRG